MRTRAALLMDQPGKWEVVDTELDDPKDHEVLVRMVASGLCHSDDHRATGDGPAPHLPLCGGHEGAGVVEAVGAGVQSLAVGDHIVTSFIPTCGRCRPCASGRQHLCQNGKFLATGSMLDGTFRMHHDGRDVARSSAIGAFAEWSVMSEGSCIKVPEHLPLSIVGLLGCGVPTGWGSAVNAAAVRPGQVVIVMGIGGIGINAVQGAAHAGAVHVIAVDPVQFKRDMALRLGATAAVSGITEAAELARSVTNGQGADAAIVTVGVVTGAHIGQAFDAIGKGGVVVVTGTGSMAEVGLPVSPFKLAMYSQRIQGCVYGNWSPAEAVPVLLDMYERGKLALDELVTRTYTLDEVNTGYDDMHAGTNIRGVITFD